MVRGRKKEIDHKWVKNNNGSISIIFSYRGKSYKFSPVKGGDFSSDEDRAIASQVARAIELEIMLGKFTGVDAWLPKQKQQIEKTSDSKAYTIKNAWENYKKAKSNSISLASQKSVWKQSDRCLEYLSSEYPLDEISPQVIIQLLQRKYSIQVIARVLSDLHAACNLALTHKLIQLNPLSGYKDYLPKLPKSERSKECYSQAEVQLILETFKDSYYASFVEFLFLTGVRPQLAIALTWGDIKPDKIVFSKGFTNGELTKGKTGRITNFPLYPQLENLLKKLCSKQSNYSDRYLVFPSPNGKNINLRNFTKRIWFPLITGLVESGKLSKYLPTYHCRHSTATFLAKAGLPPRTIAALLDTSETMLNKHYLDSQELTNVVIPDLLGKRIDVTGLEPVTPTMSTWCSNQLSYASDSY